MIRVTAVEPESIADELGLVAGSELLQVDGRMLEDFLDWEFLTAEETFLLHVRQPDGEEIEFDIERPLGEPLYVALHATDPTLRRYLLRTPTAPEIIPQLRHFGMSADHFPSVALMPSHTAP